MSNHQPDQLGAGQYYGSIVNRQAVSGLVLTELKHTQARKLPPHLHELGFFSLLLKGDYQECFGRQTVSHQPLTLTWHPQAMQHQDEVGPRGVLFFNAEVPRDWLERLREHAAAAATPLVWQGNGPVWLMMRLYREFSSAAEGYELAIEGLLLELLAAIARQPGRLESRKPVWLRRVETMIRDQFTGRLTMTQLADEAGVHPAHLASIFRRFHHTTVSDYVHRLRVQAACAMLRESAAPLVEIALQLGFADQSHFSRVFHRTTGMTPKAWRTVLIARR